MSCVVAYKEKSSIYIASDSIVSNNGSAYHMTKPKFFSPDGNDEVVIGHTGLCRIWQIAELIPFQFKNPTRRNIIEYAVAIKEAIPKEYSEERFSFIVCSRGGDMYMFKEDLFVKNVSQNYMAIGSGSDLALGALHALNPLNIDAIDKVKIALEAASLYDIHVGGKIFTKIL